MSLVSNPKDGDAVSVRQAIARLGSSKLGPTSSPTFLGITTTSLTISGLTTNSLIYPTSGLLTSLGVATNGQLPIGSTDTTPVLAALTGTANQVTVTNAAGSITLSTPQDIHTGASPTFAGLTVVNAINEFSTDGTMGGDSDSAVPTEKATKLYTDTLRSDLASVANAKGASLVGVEDSAAQFDATNVETALSELMVLVTPVEYNPAMSRTAGGDAGGNDASVATIDDADSYDTDEVSATPGFDIQAVFSGVTDFNQVQIHTAYDGNPAHVVRIDLDKTPFNWSSYDTILADIDDSSGDFIFNAITVASPGQYINSGEVRLRFYHSSAGNATHNFFIDYCALWKTGVSVGVTEHGGLTGLDDVSDHPSYLLLDGSRALTGAWDMGNQALTNINIDTGNIDPTVTQTHDGNTLQHDGVNSNGGAFAFTTSGAITFSQTLNQNVNTAGSDGLYITNSNAGATARPLLRLLNDIGEIAQLGIASSGQSTPNITLFEATKSFKITTDAADATGGTSILQINIGGYQAANKRLEISPTVMTMAVPIQMGDGDWLGQTAGPKLTFDDTNNYLEITGCNVGIGDTTPTHKLELEFTTAGDDGVFITNSSTASARTMIRLINDNSEIAQLSIASSGHSSADTTFFEATDNFRVVTDAADASGGASTFQVYVGGYSAQQRLEITTAKIVSEEPLFIKEHAAAEANVATYGQFWVLNNAPNEPWFDNDAGTSFSLDNRYVDRGDPAAVDFTSFTADGTYYDLDCSGVVPSNAVAIVFQTRIKDDLANVSLALRKNGNSNTVNVAVSNTQVSNIDIYQTHTVACDTSQVVEYRLTNTTWTTVNVTIMGWFLA